MEFSVINEPDCMHVMLSGQFTFHCNQKFKEILGLLENDSLKQVALNLKKVEFIDSAGLGMLLLLRDQCIKRNINISLREPQGQVEKIFAVSRFDQLLGISRTEH